MVQIWKVVFNNFFEAHSGCFSWILNSLHYFEFSLHILESSIGYVITIDIDYKCHINYKNGDVNNTYSKPF